MRVFRGWYLKSLARKDTVWHRVHHVDSVANDRHMVSTVCGRLIPTVKCDFGMKPDHICLQCEKPVAAITETGRAFRPICMTAINTKKEAIREIKRLIKPRTYYFKIFGRQGAKITAKWESYVSISIYIKGEIFTGRRKRRIFTLEQIEADLDRFKSAIDCLCDETTVLAKKDKVKRKLKGRLTEEEDQAYFEGLLHKAEK